MAEPSTTGSEPLTYDDIQRIALAFVMEDESWPVFLAWVTEHHGTTEAYQWARTANLASLRTAWVISGIKDRAAHLRNMYETEEKL